MFTVFCSPQHVLPQKLEAPRYMDQIGNAVPVVRRQRIRATSSWQLDVPGRQEMLDPIWGLLEYAQGDRVIWFDGAGFGEVVSPAVIFIGDGTTADIMLPHRHVYIASLVVYYDGAINAGWTPIGGDGETCDAINMPGIPLNGQITAKYRRKIKCLLKVEENMARSRVLRNQNAPSDNIHTMQFTLEEYLG